MTKTHACAVLFTIPKQSNARGYTYSSVRELEHRIILYTLQAALHNLEAASERATQRAPLWASGRIPAAARGEVTQPGEVGGVLTKGLHSSPKVHPLPSGSLSHSTWSC